VNDNNKQTIAICGLSSDETVKALQLHAMRGLSEKAATAGIKLIILDDPAVRGSGESIILVDELASTVPTIPAVLLDKIAKTSIPIPAEGFDSYLYPRNRHDRRKDAAEKRAKKK
jgi:hypothetical protein